MTDWISGSLDDLCEVEYGTRVTRKRDGGTMYPVYGGGGATFNLDDFNRQDQMIISRFAMSEECVRFVPGKFFLNDSGLTVRTRDASLMLQEFLDQQLLAKSSEIYLTARGTAQKNMDMTMFRVMEITFPDSLEEQKRIVELLDAATARVAELTACYEQARTHANNLFTSALRDALESNPDWPIRSLGEVCDFVRGVTYDKADARSEMTSGFIPLLRATNITEKGLLRDDFVFVPKNGVRADQKLISGDALITIASGSASVVGRSVLVEDPGEMTFGAFCGVLRPRPEILPRYLSHFMSSRSVRAAWSEAAQGTNINNLKRDDILQTECLLPPLEEQKRIVARLDSMKAKTPEMVAAYDAKLTVAKNLRQSILESAFAGDL